MSARATLYNPSTAQLGPLEADVARKGTQQGHLRKRGGMWHVFYRDWLAAADGSVSYGPTSASTGCTAYKAAKVKASEIVAAANASAHCPRGTATLAQFVEAQYGPARLIAKAGLSDVHLHAFRHTAATIMDQQGLSMAERQAVLGHATAAMTQHYTHAEGEAVRKKLEGLVN